MPREARSTRTQAIVLKRRDLGEADRIVTLFTPDLGKLDAVAKGARKPESHKSGHLELFTRVDVLIAKGRDLDVLVQAETLDPYLALREDLFRSAYAAYAVELLDRFAFDGDQHQARLYALIVEALGRLEWDSDPRRVLRYYELHLLELVGFKPELQRCVITQEVLLPRDQFFSFHDGGVVSPEGARQAVGLIPLRLEMLKLMRHLQRSTYKQCEKLTISASLHDDAERLMLGYLRSILESKLQSVEFIQRLRHP